MIINSNNLEACRWKFHRAVNQLWEKKGCRKLPIETVEQIVYQRLEGKRLKQIEKSCGVSEVTITEYSKDIAVKPDVVYWFRLLRVFEGKPIPEHVNNPKYKPNGDIKLKRTRGCNS